MARPAGVVSQWTAAIETREHFPIKMDSSDRKGIAQPQSVRARIVEKVVQLFPNVL
jgi:hypothetical protein